MMDTLRLAKENGAKVILITHYDDAPGVALADVVLLCGAQENPLDSGSIPPSWRCFLSQMCWSCATPLTIRSLPTSRSPAPVRRWAASCFDGFLSSKKNCKPAICRLAIFYPRRGSFHRSLPFYCPASAICSRVMGSS